MMVMFATSCKESDFNKLRLDDDPREEEAEGGNLDFNHFQTLSSDYHDYLNDYHQDEI